MVTLKFNNAILTSSLTNKLSLNGLLTHWKKELFYYIESLVILKSLRLLLLMCTKNKELNLNKLVLRNISNQNRLSKLRVVLIDESLSKGKH